MDTTNMQHVFEVHSQWALHSRLLTQLHVLYDATVTLYCIYPPKKIKVKLR